MPDLGGRADFKRFMRSTTVVRRARLDNARRESDKQLKKEIGPLAQACARRVSSYAPVDTGALRDSIAADEDEREKGVWYIHDGPGVKDRLYGHYVELGTVKTGAQPYMLNGVLDEVRDRGYNVEGFKSRFYSLVSGPEGEPVRIPGS